MASESPSPAEPDKTTSKRESAKLPTPYEPPNPYDILPPGADEKEITPKMERKRDSQYIPYSPDMVAPIEQDPHQLPQVVIESAPEVVVVDDTTPTTAASGVGSTAPIIGNKEARAHQDGLPLPNGTSSVNEPDGIVSWVRQRSKKSLWICAGVILFLLIAIGVATGVAVSLSNKNKDSGAEYVGSPDAHPASGQPGEGSSTDPESGLTPHSSSSPSSTNTTGTGEPTSTSTAKPSVDTSRCMSEKTWLDQVGFLGTADTGKYAQWVYAAVSNAEDCCIACYNNDVTDGCIAWNWNPYNTGGEMFYCTVYHKAKGNDKDDTCPNGHVNMVFNSQDEDKPKSVADIGPCGDRRE